MHTSKTLFGLLTALVFVFGMESTAYGQTPILQEFEKLNASNDTQDRFGQNSAIYVDTAIVGAYDVDINGIHSGAAFIYRFDGNTWVEEPILLPSQSSAYAYFGWDVSISGDVAVVSAPGDKVVFVFQFDGTNWNESANISLNNSSNDMFGLSVSVDVNRIIVGAPGDNVNGSTSGVAYIFEYDGTSWNQQAHLIPSNGSTEDFFGGSVSISGDRALVGAGEQPGTGGGSGTAYIYEYDGTTWNNESILTPSNGNNSDYFGQAVSLQGDVAVIGSMQFDGAGNQSGAAYVYRYDGNDWDDETVLRASDSVIGQFFGASVCTSDEIIIVGAIGDATSGVQTGAAYVFWYDYTSNTWNEQVKLLPSDAESGDWFGQSVGVHEGTAIVCSWYEDDNGTDAGAGYLYHVGDLDGDSIIDGFDNCIDIFNPNQEDCNANGVGDVCDLLYPATFDCNNNGLVDSCELYTFDIETKILASDGGTYDRFGISVAVDGDTVVVGADGDDDNGSYSGSAYIYRFDGSSWIETKLIASDGASNEYFGYSVAVDGDTVVVGAYLDNDNGSQSGSAYIYRFDGSNWIETKLTASDGASYDNFGISVAVDGDTVVVGSYGDGDNGSYSGSAYIYRFDGTDWIETKLLASDGGNYDWFGESVAVDGDTVVVGAHFDNDNAIYSGSAYIYRFDGTDWIETKLLASDGGTYHWFGISVAVDGDTVVVGSSGDDDNGTDSGSAYIYRFDGSNWIETKLIASDGTSGDYFGYRVAVDGDTVVVGARYDDDNGFSSGSAYIYRFDGTDWNETKLTASDGASSDYFGSSVAVDGDTVAVGAFWDDDNGTDSGSAYIYQSSTNDCNLNGIPDECDIADGTSDDLDGDGIPDECGTLSGNRSDFDGNGQVNIDDLLQLIGAFGNAGGVEDLDEDGFVDIDDMLILIGDWGPVV